MSSQSETKKNDHGKQSLEEQEIQPQKKVKTEKKSQWPRLVAFFDTETLAIKNQETPRMVEFASVIVTQDKEGNFLPETMVKYETLIKPVGFEICEEDTKIHTITQQQAEQEGQLIEKVLDQITKQWENVEEIIAYNIQFDMRVLKNECRLSDHQKLLDLLDSKIKHCAQQFAQDLLQPQGHRLKLKTLYEDNFPGEKWDQKNRALDNTERTFKLFDKLMNDQRRRLGIRNSNTTQPFQPPQPPQPPQLAQPQQQQQPPKNMIEQNLNEGIFVAFYDMESFTEEYFKHAKIKKVDLKVICRCDKIINPDEATQVQENLLNNKKPKWKAFMGFKAKFGGYISANCFKEECMQKLTGLTAEEFENQPEKEPKEKDFYLMTFQAKEETYNGNKQIRYYLQKVQDIDSEESQEQN